MLLDSYNPGSRYRNRVRQKTTTAMTVVVMAGLCFGVGFWSGKRYAATQLVAMNEEIDAINQQRNVLQDNMTELKAEAQTAALRYEQLKNQLDETLPEEGPLRTLVALVKSQIEAGINPERLEFAIKSARPPQNCTDPQIKQIIVSTPAYKGPPSSTKIDNGISISATGHSAQSQNGQPEAWFDPAKSVVVTFSEADGKKIEKKGNLPLQHSIVAGEREYRFTISEGVKSFARITFDSCDYP